MIYRAFNQSVWSNVIYGVMKFGFFNRSTIKSGVYASFIIGVKVNDGQHGNIGPCGMDSFSNILHETIPVWPRLCWCTMPQAIHIREYTIVKKWHDILLWFEYDII